MAWFFCMLDVSAAYSAVIVTDKAKEGENVGGS